MARELQRREYERAKKEEQMIREQKKIEAEIRRQTLQGQQRMQAQRLRQDVEEEG